MASVNISAVPKGSTSNLVKSPAARNNNLFMHKTRKLPRNGLNITTRVPTQCFLNSSITSGVLQVESISTEAVRETPSP